MAERIQLTTPASVTVTYYDLTFLELAPMSQSITVKLVSDQGHKVVKTYDATTVPTGATLLGQVNRGNFSGATSLMKAIYNRLLTDGVIAAGSVIGVAQ